MKKTSSNYTFLIIKNDSSNTRAINLSKKTVRALLAGFICLILMMTAFLTDYLGLYVDQWKISQLQKEKTELTNRLYSLGTQLKNLETKVGQVSDFSRKIQLITNADLHNINPSKVIGKVQANSSLTGFSNAPIDSLVGRHPAHSNSSPNQASMISPLEDEQLELRIERLTEKTELVKQSSWTLYTDLLERKELIDNTPSLLPARGWISSSFGFRNETIFQDHEPYFHKGVDVAARQGSSVFSTADGKVVFTGYDESGFGNLVVVDHGYGLKTYYGHLSKIHAKIGQVVKKGEVIAEVGNTGKSTGPHLHYEVRIFNVPVNPENYILDEALYPFSEVL